MADSDTAAAPGPLAERHAEQLAILRDIGRAALQARSAEQLAMEAVARLRGFVGCDRAALTVFEEDGAWLRVLAASAAPGLTGFAPGQRFPRSDWKGFVAADLQPDAMLTAQTVHVPDLATVAARPPSSERAYREGIRSVLSAPLEAEGRYLGRLFLVSRTPDAFSPLDRDVLGDVAGQLALALQSTRLRDALAARAHELEHRVAERTAELREINEELESFCSTVAHDLRAPLRAVQGFAAAVAEDYAERLDATGRGYLGRIQAATLRMEQLISDLLAYSRLRRSALRLGPVSLGEVVAEARERLAAELAERGTVLKVDEPLPEVIGEGGLLVQVVANLLSNAAKFVAPGTCPEVELRCQRDAGRVRLSVSDNGIGIAPEHQERIFRVFERLHGIESFPGTGVGLAIVRTGAERMGGACGVSSRPGFGSTFWIELAGVER